MKVLVDTCVWSQALRRKSPDMGVVERLSDYIRDGRIALIGPVRQELLSGISDSAQFRRLREKMAAFPDIPLMTQHFERAAEFHNACRKRGVQVT